MRVPSLLAQCLPGLLPSDKAGSGVSVAAYKDPLLPSPAVEILPAKKTQPYKYVGENMELQGVNIFKARISVTDMITLTSSPESISSKSDGSMKIWESSIELVNVLKHEIRDGQLSFRGKRVLELGCGYGLSGIVACLKGASLVHFQDQNSETVRCTTIPNVLANLEQARERQNRPSGSPLTPSWLASPSDVHFYAGDWDELPTVLSIVQKDASEAHTGLHLSFSEDDFMDVCSSQDGSIVGNESGARRSRKLSGSRAWERATEVASADGGYDIILISDIPSSASSLRKFYALLKKCLRPPYGVLYLAARKCLMSSNNGARQLRSLVDEESIFGGHLLVEVGDREIWKFFHK